MALSGGLSILYRGPLSSCNYGCGYCPFAKRDETHAELAGDRAALTRFTAWVGAQSDRQIGALFTPWGEALTRYWYQDALAELTRMPHVRRAAIQTNLSCRLDWIDRCDCERLALWCTHHPGEVPRERFLEQCRELHGRGVRFSVGIVGLKEHFDDAKALRDALPADVYLWVNAYKREGAYYAEDDLRAFEALDPLFRVNTIRHPSRGLFCRAGASVISVDGDGVMRRCHFVKEPIGNIYSAEWAEALRERPCPNETCGCHIGYVHLDALKQDAVYGDGILERIPISLGS